LTDLPLGWGDKQFFSTSWLPSVPDCFFVSSLPLRTEFEGETLLSTRAAFFFPPQHTSLPVKEALRAYEICFAAGI